MTVINTASFAYHQRPLTGQDLSHFLHKVALDNSFNRYACWNENSASEFLRNVIVGFAPNPIIFANLKNCLEYCIEGSPEYDYFNGWIQKGYEYLAIDGNNRTTSIRKYLNNEISIAHGTFMIDGCSPITIDDDNDTFKNHPLEFKKYIESDVFVTMCEYTLTSREQVSDLFYYVNEGKPLKDQEKRNAIICKMADEIREITAKFEPNNKMYKNNIHYKFDELMVKCAVLFANGPSGISQATMYDAYKDNSITYQAWVKKPGINGRRMTEIANRLTNLYNGKSINPSTFLNLFMSLYILNLSKKKIENEEAYIEWFMASESKRLGSKEVLVSNSKGDHTYEGLCGGTTKVDLMPRFEMISRDLKDCTFVSGQPELDPNRIFSRVQRYEAWRNQKGLTPDGEIIPESEVNDVEKWHADHVVPFSLGGLTTVENCRLISKDANLRKGNRA
jgi:hypothetical protein